jgi:hypothetical protein
MYLQLTTTLKTQALQLRAKIPQNWCKLGSRLEGRFVAENVKKHIKAGELVTPQIALDIDQDESINPCVS